MDYYRDEILKILHELEKCLDSYIVEKGRLPTGHLICTRNHGKRQFIQVDTTDGKYKRRCINKQPELIRQLARKEFLTRSIMSIKSNMDILDKTLKQLKDLDPITIMDSMRKAYRELPREYFFDPGSLPLHVCSDVDLLRKMERHMEWASRDYLKSTYLPERRTKPTSQGLYVRSKSEQLIAEMLHKYGIPFRYEQVIPIGAREFSADFSFEAADGSEFFWEHAGMMDDPSYADSHLRKLRNYHSVGIYPGRNLLISYDRDGNLNMAIIEAMVQNEVLPRL